MNRPVGEKLVWATVLVHGSDKKSHLLSRMNPKRIKSCRRRQRDRVEQRIKGGSGAGGGL